MSETHLPEGFQYSDPEHQAWTAISGMWLFLATEVLFFGALFLAWLFARHWNQAGFDAGGRETEIVIGTINSVILLVSSFAYAVGVASIRDGDNAWLIRCCAVAATLGLAFLILKFGIEWRDDLAKHLFPGADFSIEGANRGGAQSFFVFYFLGTGLHGLHLVVGIALVAWIIRRARRLDFSSAYHTPVVVVGLYWGFVDMVWIVLYPLIYLIGRGP